MCFIPRWVVSVHRSSLGSGLRLIQPSVGLPDECWLEATWSRSKTKSEHLGHRAGRLPQRLPARDLDTRVGTLDVAVPKPGSTDNEPGWRAVNVQMRSVT